LYKLKEGLCVQCLHIGSYNDEPKTLELIDNYIKGNRLSKDITEKRQHHEIYLSDPRKTEPKKLKTVLRIPVKKIMVYAPMSYNRSVYASPPFGRLGLRFC
jgi:hypothetical protein